MLSINLVPRVLSYSAPVAREREREEGHGGRVGEDPRNEVVLSVSFPFPGILTPRPNVTSARSTDREDGTRQSSLTSISFDFIKRIDKVMFRARHVLSSLGCIL